jgi:hypothetical protein
MSALAPILQAYFTDKLIRQRRAGPNTLSAYRDTWRLLLQFASHTTATAPSGLDLAQIDAELVTAFLTHLETARGNTVATRNARLAAIRSLFRYAALSETSDNAAYLQWTIIRSGRVVGSEFRCKGAAWRCELLRIISGLPIVVPVVVLRSDRRQRWVDGCGLRRCRGRWLGTQQGSSGG